MCSACKQAATHARGGMLGSKRHPRFEVKGVDPACLLRVQYCNVPSVRALSIATTPRGTFANLHCVDTCGKAVCAVCADLWGGVAHLQHLPLLHFALVVAGSVQPFAQRTLFQGLWLLLLLLALSALLLLLLLLV